MMPARAGFTLIEVLIATSLLTIGLATAAFLMTGAYTTYRGQNRTLEMNHLVHDQMEKITSTSYETFQNDIKRARKPGEDFRKDLPPERDFELAEGNGVRARYEMIPPPPERDDYTIVRKGSITKWVEGGTQKANTVNVSMKLEYWDPVFDRPVEEDKGLIRAQYDIEWSGAREHGVKYVTR